MVKKWGEIVTAIKIRKAEFPSAKTSPSLAIHFLKLCAKGTILDTGSFNNAHSRDQMMYKMCEDELVLVTQGEGDWFISCGQRHL